MRISYHVSRAPHARHRRTTSSAATSAVGTALSATTATTPTARRSASRSLVVTIAKPIRPPTRIFTLDQGATVGEWLFCVAVFLPGPLLYAFVAESHAWGLLCVLTFAYLAASNLPPTSTVSVGNHGGELHVVRKETLFASPQDKTKVGYQLMIGSATDTASLTSETLAVGPVAETLQHAGREMAKFLSVPFVVVEAPPVEEPKRPTATVKAAIGARQSRPTPATFEPNDPTEQSNDE
ncbi:hypothetical protein AMAG_10414 [Allomyces macrogynus ATCC 38327]|uniref:Uncharacterized protein n=1 Tax=Allomyces macrogynus (strain ATCC 38327) TaxID=578462 RepID=A0A0L0SUV1_ALLM3|nr:hypothetical protein AMAG_10414 [Allomyces macrogynus ATCC 38327]|eukprot:KNE66165.1 hypothetical protein AMAG_10414 [Allomyces macrogynus ATCC 38327]